MTTSAAEVAEALHQNHHQPYGPVRSARAEELTELAAQTGDRPLLISALQDQIQCHEYDGERERILVPFARVLHMWDENPADFDEGAAYRLHWHFKWVASSMVRHPNVSLAAVEHWLSEMDTRYHQAGYGSHAVHNCRHMVAVHVGDLDAAGREFEAWTSAKRDQMSDCHACDCAEQGLWFATTGRDADALDHWQPVLTGRLRCQEEPHRTLANALLPLLRLGRFDEARAFHLRGYRLVRGGLGLRASVGRHIEFAALSGNEARGLEMLADHSAWVTETNMSPGERLAFLEGVTVLLRRLAALGHADLAISLPGGSRPVSELGAQVEAEIAELVGRFDDRNGTSAVGDRSRARLDRAPLVAELPLGVRAAALAAPTSAPVALTPADADPVARARDLSRRHHPGAAAAWERVAGSGVELTPELHARIAQARAIAASGQDEDKGRRRLLDVAGQFAAVGDVGRSMTNQARAAVAATLAGDTATGASETSALIEEAADRHASGAIDDAALLRIRLEAAQESMFRWIPDIPQSLEELTPADMPSAPPSDFRDRAEALRDVAERLDDSYYRAQAELLFSQLAAFALDLERASAHLRASVELAGRAQAPWLAVGPLTALATAALETGDAVAAERYAGEGVAVGRVADADDLAQFHHLRATAIERQGGREREVVDDALRAAHLLDRIDAARALRSRLLAAQAFHRDGRAAEAVGLLEAVRPDAEQHGSQQQRVWLDRTLATCLTGLNEHRDAAEALARAALIAAGWEDQHTHASIAHESGAALGRAAMIGPAEQAFARAAQLWGDLGERATQVRAVRAGAWLRIRREETDWPEALAMLESAAVLADDDRDDADVAYERLETTLQIGQLLAQWPAGDDRPADSAERALAAAEQAAAGLVDLRFAQSVTAHLLAAQIEAQRLDRRDAAIARIERVRDQCVERGDDTSAGACERRLAQLARRRPDE